ncbi:putative meiosis-specific topoisomerase Spo11 [Aspergillus undulatus]|uniref:putative meiosis-specific topoisomerase Spo11 n=1 Tax=Aspergillus undulatus TaxID=1810928 RepID=UPI003CCD0E5C
MDPDFVNLLPATCTNNLTPRSRVHKYLQDTLETVLTQLTLSEDATITLKRRAANATTTFHLDPSTGALESGQAESTITYSFPGKDAYEAWRFTIALRILSAVHDALQKGLPVSIRDIYYTDPEYFESQGVVGRFVDKLALTIGVERADLNVEAAAKGLVAGYYRLTTTRGEVIDARGSTTDSLIPRVQDITELDISDVRWILIIEKEAVFRRLARDNFHNRAAAGKGILITGKGYPDLATRAFARRILENIAPSQSQTPSQSQSSPSHIQSPIFYALVDGDPDGTAIMSTYKYGSMAHTCENARLNLPCLRWLGLRTSEVIGGIGHDGDEALIPLSKRDRKKIVSMLGRSPMLAVDGSEMEWRTELQLMLMLNVKAEIEILHDRAGGLEGWLDREMGRRKS